MIFHRKKGKKGAVNSGDEASSSSLSRRTARQFAEPTRPVFNVPLNVALENMPSLDGIPVVALVRYCIDYVYDNGLKVEGIYRISASKSVLDEQEMAINCGEPVSFDDVHDAANIFKRFLRGLPEHILTNSYIQEVELIANQCICVSSDPCRCNVAPQLKEFLSKKLPAANFYLLGYVFLHAQHVILHQNENKMNLIAFGVLLQAILKLSKHEVRIFLLNASSLLLKDGDQPIIELFTDIPFERYTPNVSINTNSATNSNTVATDISRQEELLLDISKQLERISDKKSPEARDKERQIQKLRQSISDLKQQINKKTNNISSPASNSDKSKPNKNGQPVKVGALPPVFLEKQLLAVHISLQHEISDEKKKVVQLLTKLRSIQNELPAEQLESFDQLPVHPSPTPSISNVNEISEEDAKQLEAKQSQLLAEITYYRDLAARLRSRLEQCTVLLANTERQAMHKDLGSTTDDADANNSLLVTRF